MVNKRPAKMPEMLVNCGNSTLPTPEPAHTNCTSQEPDWEQLADKEVQNADLDTANFLPLPPEVITIKDKDNYPVTTILAVNSHLLIILKIDPDGPPPPIPPSPPDPMPSRYPIRSCQASQHLDDYHLFTKVA
jgi:hypothetical protein